MGIRRDVEGFIRLPKQTWRLIGSPSEKDCGLFSALPGLPWVVLKIKAPFWYP